MSMNRRFHVGALLAVLALPLPAVAGPIQATLYKIPQCGCCETYATYLRGHGFDVKVKETQELAEISRDAGVPPKMQGCHTMFVDGYVVDGHVPVNVIRKLLADRPPVAILLSGHPPQPLSIDFGYVLRANQLHRRLDYALPFEVIFRCGRPDPRLILHCRFRLLLARGKGGRPPS